MRQEIRTNDWGFNHTWIIIFNLQIIIWLISMNSVTQFDLGTEIPKNFYESKQFKQLRQNLEDTKQSYFLTG